MIIGLSGAHRTGKSTLMNAWSEENDVPKILFPTVSVIQSLGLSGPKDITTIEMRLKVQRKLVETCDRVFLGKRVPHISDRTPIDVAAYMLCDIAQGFMTDEQQQEAMEIVEDCIDITNAAFNAALILPPALPYIVELGKPLPNVAYQEHFHLVVQGLMSDTRVVTPYWVLSREAIKMEDRLSGLDAIFEALMDDTLSECQLATLN